MDDEKKGELEEGRKIWEKQHALRELKKTKTLGVVLTSTTILFCLLDIRYFEWGWFEKLYVASLIAWFFLYYNAGVYPESKWWGKFRTFAIWAVGISLLVHIVNPDHLQATRNSPCKTEWDGRSNPTVCD